MAAPRSVSPVAAFRPRAAIPPIAPTIPPTVGDPELAITSLSSATPAGRAAGRDARKTRFTPSTSSTATDSSSPWPPDAMMAAVTTTNAERSRADKTRIWRRDQRSMKTPANGPMTEYGRDKTGNATAAADGLRKGLAVKKTYVAHARAADPRPR